MMAEPDGELCECNSRGCLESIVSQDRIVEEVFKRLEDYPKSLLNNGQEISISRIFAAAQECDELALRVSQRAVRTLGAGLVNCVNLLNPEHIVLTGWVCENSWFSDQVKKYVYTYGFESVVATLKDISPSALKGETAYVLGAASLCDINVVSK